MRQQQERDGLCLSSAVPKIQWDSNPHCSTAIRLWETFTLVKSEITAAFYTNILLFFHC